MSAQNVEVVRSYLDAFNRGDIETVFSHFHPDIEFHEPETVPYGGVHRGIEGMQRFLGLVAEHLVPESIHLVPIELLDAGDTVVARALLQASARATGTELDVPLVEVVRVQDGRLREILIYSDTAAIVAATRAPAAATA